MQANENRGLSRRAFLRMTSMVAAGGVLMACVPQGANAPAASTDGAAPAAECSQPPRQRRKRGDAREHGQKQIARNRPEAGDAEQPQHDRRQQAAQRRRDDADREDRPRFHVAGVTRWAG